MMKNSSVIVFAVLFLSFYSCGQPTTKDNKTESVKNETTTGSFKKTKNGEKGITKDGYEYVHHVSNNTSRPEVGDQVKYHKVVYKNDTSLLQSTYYLLEPRADILISPDSVPQPPHPTYAALFMMSPGDSMTVYQQLDTFPPERLPEGITNKDHFTYTLKLLDIKPKAVIEKEIEAVKARHFSVTDSLRSFIQSFKAGKLDDQIVATGSGLRYVRTKEGTGKQVKDGGFVKVHYLGMLEDGTLFDGSFASAKPFPTRIGRKRVIAGWDEGIPLLKEGGEAFFIVPYQLGYGISGKPPGIPQRADLYFFVSLVGVY